MSLQPLSDLPLPPELALDEAPFDVDELENYDEDRDVPADHPARSWRIEDDGAAEWAMRNLVARRQTIDELARRRDDWMARIDAWFAQASKGPARSAVFFEGALGDYQRRRREADEEAKSLVLPSGRITSTGTGGKATVENEEEVLTWVREHGWWDDVVKDEPHVRIGDLRKRVRVVEIFEGVDLHCTLSCGHVGVTHRSADNWPADPPASLPCGLCDPDPIDESAPYRDVTDVEVEEIRKPTAIASDLGYPIPGLAVEPAGFNVAVKPDA